MGESPNTSLDAILAKVRSCMAGRPEILFGYIFGSVARAEARPDSDVDVAVFLDQETTGVETSTFRSSFLAELLKCLSRNDVDLVILNQAPVVLRHRVLRDGNLVISRDETRRVAFAVDTLRRYVDTASLRRLSEEYTRRSLENGTYGREVPYKAVFGPR